MEKTSTVQSKKKLFHLTLHKVYSEIKSIFTARSTRSFHELAGFFIALTAVLLYRHFTYIGLLHDARIYAADLFRVPAMSPQDLLSLSPQQNGTIFNLIFAPVCRLFFIESVFHTAYLLLSACNFLLTYYLLKTLIRSTKQLRIILAAVFNVLRWEVLTNVIQLNETFFTVRPIAFFFFQLALLTAILYRKEKTNHLLIASGLSIGLCFSFHPISAIYFFPAYLVFAPKTWRYLITGVLIGLLPFIIMQVCIRIGSNISDYQDGNWTSQLILLVVRKNYYLFPTMWSLQSQERIFSTVLFLFYLSYIYKKERFGRICFITTLLCSLFIALYVLTDYHQIYNQYLVSIQPLRSFAVLNLYLFILLCRWLTDVSKEMEPYPQRLLVFSLFLIVEFNVSFDLSLVLFAMLTVWRFYPPVRTWKIAWYSIMLYIFFMCLVETYPFFYRFGFKYHPAQFITVFIVAGVISEVIYIFRKLMNRFLYISIVLALTFSLNKQRIDNFHWSECRSNSNAVSNLKCSIPDGATICYLPDHIKTDIDLSILRCDQRQLKVYVSKIDRAPACFSARYSMEYLRRITLINLYSSKTDKPELLLSFLRRENIHYVISKSERPLRLVNQNKKYKLYAVNQEHGFKKNNELTSEITWVK